MPTHLGLAAVDFALSVGTGYAISALLCFSVFVLFLVCNVCNPVGASANDDAHSAVYYSESPAYVQINAQTHSRRQLVFRFVDEEESDSEASEEEALTEDSDDEVLAEKNKGKASHGTAASGDEDWESE